MDVPATLQQIAALTVDERLRIVEAIWDSIAAEPGQPELTEAQAEELDHRLSEHLTSPGDTIPWEQVEAEALARART